MGGVLALLVLGAGLCAEDDTGEDTRGRAATRSLRSDDGTIRLELPADGQAAPVAPDQALLAVDALGGRLMLTPVDVRDPDVRSRVACNAQVYGYAEHRWVAEGEALLAREAYARFLARNLRPVAPRRISARRFPRSRQGNGWTCVVSPISPSGSCPGWARPATASVARRSRWPLPSSC